MTLERSRESYARFTQLVIKLFPNRPVPKSACCTQRPPQLPIRCRDAVNRTVTAFVQIDILYLISPALWSKFLHSMPVPFTFRHCQRHDTVRQLFPLRDRVSHSLKSAMSNVITLHRGKELVRIAFKQDTLSFLKTLLEP